MTDETTPGEPVDPYTSAESDASIPAVEPESPAPWAEPVADVPTAEPVAVFSAPVPTEPAPQPAPVPTPQPAPAPAPVPQATQVLGPTIPSGSRVVVMVSRGPSPMPPVAFVTVPEVVGMSQGDALAKLQESGLPSQVFNDYNGRLPRGEVMGQLPAPGASVPAGAESVLMVSSGPAAAPTISSALPNVVGLAESDAVSRLQAVGLSPQLVREYSPNIPDGIVVAQLPNSASLIEMPKKRSLLWLWILLGVLVIAALGVGAYLYLNRTGIVPAVVGLTQADATTAINSAGFKIETIEMTQSIKASDVGKVVGQTPVANTEAKMSVGVVISVSGGQKLLEVPTVTGKTQADAESALKAAGLKASVTKGFSSTVVKGVVVSQAPEAGQKVPSETSVGIVISEGAQNVVVPGVSGQSQSAATSSLKSLGLGTQVVTNYGSTPKGQVADQFPSAGTAVPPGTIVGLIVSGGPVPSGNSTATVTVVSVVGKTSASAESTLKSIGLKPVVIQWSGTGQPANQVVGQTPDGATVPKNSSVLIFVSNGK
jgi:beta-lactam-binding protein with PASTA domain